MQLICVENFKNNPKIISELIELTKPSYIDNSLVLEREINHCNKIYLLYDEGDKIVAFFMVNFEIIGNYNTYYLGLSGCSHVHKGKGYAKYLYNSFFLHCKKKEIELSSKILCWWTTATPIVFHWFNHNIENCEPNLDGDITEFGQEIFETIVKNKYNNVELNKSSPFILNRVAEKTNYSTIEAQRITKIKEQLNIKAFSLYPIDENKGDRYLMIGFAPSLEILNARLNEYH